MGNLRLPSAIFFGLLAWAAFGVMVVAPWFDTQPSWFSPRLGYALELTPVVFTLSLISFSLANAPGRKADLTAAISTLAALALLLYWVIPWALNWFGRDY